MFLSWSSALVTRLLRKPESFIPTLRSSPWAAALASGLYLAASFFSWRVKRTACQRTMEDIFGHHTLLCQEGWVPVYQDVLLD